MMNYYDKFRVQWHSVVALALFLCSLLVVAADYQSIPQLEGRVTDVANVLSVADRDRLAKTLARYEQETSHQFAVLLIPTLSEESIESFSLRVAKAWGLGQKGLNNGILVTLAMKERMVRIELGLGMERYISNEFAQSIITNTMGPAFRKGDYAGGLQAGLEQLMKEGRQFVVTPTDPLERAYDLGVQAYQAKDFALAREHWSKAIEEDELLAYNNLGYLLYYAHGGPPDRPRAVSLWRIGATRGHSEAQRHLGQAFEDGTDLPRSYVEAYAWYRCAIASTEAAPESERKLQSEIGKDAVKSLDQVRKRLAREQIREAERLAKRYIAAYARRS